jgi:predicted small integral membrane protein
MSTSSVKGPSGLLRLGTLPGGFIVIGGEWFQMWQSQDWNGLDPALQNVTVAGLALILAHLPSREWDTPA